MAYHLYLQNFIIINILLSGEGTEPSVMRELVLENPPSLGLAFSQHTTYFHGLCF